MDFGQILKTVGSGIIRQIFPAAGAVIDVVNGFLPKDKKLPNNATGEQVQSAIDTLGPEDKAALMSKELDVEMAEINGWSDVVGSLADADKTGNTTRPRIAIMMAWAVLLTVVVFLVGFIYAVVSSDDRILQTISESWEVMGIVLATPTALLRGYFGLRTKEKTARYATATGQPQVSGVAGVLGSLLGKK
jgi:hypothetical protein